ncbi:MAG: serine/threonine protein kinase [Deltaproteobacteria bacterium]|nr:serine/threonine protein kinase [Deltaproteobacteria bacterium]
MARKQKSAGKSAWGDDVTRYFFDLGPDEVLKAVEDAGYECTGLCYALNSYENRVYEVEIEPVRNGPPSTLAQPRRRVVKFYRPGRWTPDQIREEHQFIADLAGSEVPAVSPVPFPDGSTLREVPSGGIWYTVFPKIGGRIPDELDRPMLRRVGRLLGRLHMAGAARPARHRIRLTPETYGLANLEFLLSGGWFPAEQRDFFERVIREICSIADGLFDGVSMIRTHGDCHRGNLLVNGEQMFLVDFDDMVTAPPVQDLWLLLPGSGEEVRDDLEEMLEGYDEMNRFDRRTLHLIEPLRALRMIHFAAWIARRWQDPVFPRTFVQFNTPRYWNELANDLAEQLARIKEIP